MYESLRFHKSLQQLSDLKSSKVYKLLLSPEAKPF